MLLAGIFSSNPAQALQFNFTYGNDTSEEIINGFETAGDIWSSKFQDHFLDSDCSCERNTTINIKVDFTQLSNSKGLGAANPEMVSVDYNEFLNHSFKKINSTDDLNAFKSFQISQSDKENFLQVLGVDLINKDFAENYNVLQEQGFNVQSKIKGVKPKSNDLITAQAGDILQQLNLEQIEQLNHDQINFSSSTFKMQIDDDSKGKGKGLDKKTVIDEDNSINNRTIWLTRGNSKVLGLTNGSHHKLDAKISLSNSMLSANGDIISHDDWLNQNPQGNFLEDTIWDFSRVDDSNAKVASHKFDFLSVALHEIGHTLGVVSGVDALSSLKIQTEANNETLSEKDTALVSPMDLMRFSEESAQKSVFDWSSSGNTFLSIDGGKTKIADFADGLSYQTSHWSEKGDLNGNALGIMHPVLKRGEKLDITDLDLQLLDVLGYTKSKGEVNNLLQDSQNKQKKAKKEKNKKNKKSEPETDFDISYSKSMSSSSGFNFWQEADITDHHRTDPFTATNQQYKTATTPEPNTIVGLGILGIFGWLHRRMRKG